MANRFRSGTRDVQLSNARTAVVFDVLALAGAARARTDWERRLIYWLVQHDQERIGLGMAGFDIEDLGWTGDDLAAQQAFVLGIFDDAIAGVRWERMPFPPDPDTLLPTLRALRALVETLPEGVRAPRGDRWIPDELPPHGDCERHGVPRHELGCIVCNDAPIRTPIDAPWLAAFAAFLAGDDLLVPWARAERCLPVFRDWTHAYAVTRGCELLAVGIDPHGPTRLVLDLRERNLVVIQGEAAYPWLAVLRPARPDDAQPCSYCDGGAIAMPPPVICYCGGAGWVPVTSSGALPRSS